MYSLKPYLKLSIIFRPQAFLSLHLHAGIHWIEPCNDDFHIPIIICVVLHTTDDG